jgi:hypothetical protein
MAIPVSGEKLEPADWQPDEQRAVYDAIAVNLSIPQQADYSAMTDEELLAELKKLYDEMTTRGSATLSVLDAVQMGGASIFSVRP